MTVSLVCVRVQCFVALFLFVFLILGCDVNFTYNGDPPRGQFRFHAATVDRGYGSMKDSGKPHLDSVQDVTFEHYLLPWVWQV